MPSWSSSCFRSLKRDSGERHLKGRNKYNATSTVEDRCFSLISEEKRGISFVELVKKEGSTLGIILSGGVDKGSKPKISNLRPGSIAHRCDALAVGDYLVSVNGIRTVNLRHEEIVNLLKNAGDRVTLEVEYEIPISSAEGSLGVYPKGIQVKLEKENDSFGFTLRGGVCSDKLKSRPLTITHVRLGGPADRIGYVKAGDRLLAVNGINLSFATLQEALMVLKQASHSTLFTIEYDISIIDTVRNAIGPLLVEIEKTPGNQLGINLACILTPQPSIVIESIKQASIAERKWWRQHSECNTVNETVLKMPAKLGLIHLGESILEPGYTCVDPISHVRLRCGALHVGDHILAIDSVKVDLMTAAEAMQLLRTSGDLIKLEILPLSQMQHRRIPNTMVKQSVGVPYYSGTNGSCYYSHYNSLSSVDGLSTCSYPANFARNCKMNRSFTFRQSPKSVFSSSNISLMSGASSFPAIGLVDITEVTLLADHRGFGFKLQGSTFASDMLNTPPFISIIDDGSPAEKCGVLKVDDRVLAVNGESIEGLTLDEVNHLIAHSDPKVTLTIEFDVEESVVPSSGTFMVKLAKKGAGLGIAVTAPKNRQPGEPLIISDVKKGSTAHRTGTIQPGDRLLAVDMIRMESCTVEDASEILFSCNELVKLRIRKDETYSDDPDVNSAVVYTVELARHGGPLGITLVGTNEPFQPIYISNLTKNGLADRTGALHAGDMILAINGFSLRGKTVNEAIGILQNCGDEITLKILKNLYPGKTCQGDKSPKCLCSVQENNRKSYTIPPSIDSAVESWNSCGIDPSKRASSKAKGSLSSRGDSQTQNTNQLEPCASAAASEAQFNSEVWDIKSDDTHYSSTYSVSQSMPSEDDLENWSKVLEDLQTCGQSGLLRQIERSILGEDESKLLVHIHDFQNIVPDVHKNVNSQSEILSDETLEVLNSEIEQLEFAELPTPEQQTIHSHCRKLQENIESNSNNSEELDNFRSSLSPYSAPLPLEIHKVTLFKDHVYNNFGFSISDGLYEPGVFIKNIRSGGPADVNGLVKPYDRILQVNDVKIFNFNCDHAIPLIANSGDRIELVISRPAYLSVSSSESTFVRNGIHQQLLQEENLINYPFSGYTESPILTKTL